MVPNDTSRGENGPPDTPKPFVEPWLEYLLHDLRQLEATSIEAGDVFTIEQIHALLTLLLQVRQLQNNFHRSPSRAIDGANGVSQRLGISRNGVYKRIAALGLDVEDFRVPATFTDLIQRSTKIPDMITQLQLKIHGRQDRARRPR